MKLNYEQEISDHESTFKEKNALKNENTKKDKLIKLLKEDQKKLEQEIETSEKNSKSLSKSLKSKEKDIYEIKKENVKLKEDFDQVKAELEKIRTIANQEKKELERKLKKVEKKDFLNNLKSGSKQTDKIPCGHCDEKLESNDKSMRHIEIHHQQNSSLQTEENSLETKSVQCDLDRRIYVQKKDAEQMLLKKPLIIFIMKQ